MSKSDFESLYKNVPIEQRNQLLEFRAAHPYKQLPIDAVSWHYIACGQGEKTLLLLPGALMKADMWFQAILAFEKNYRIIIPDNYALQDTFNMQDICRAHAIILDAEGVGQATVIGISGGAGVAQFFLQDYPHRVEHIVFSHCGVVKPENAPGFQKRVKMIRLTPYSILKRILRASARSRWEYPPSSEWVEFRNAYLSEMGRLLNKQILLQFMEEGVEAHRGFSFNPQVLRDFPGKILILSSKGDAWTAMQEDELRERYPGAQTHVFEQGGHHTFMLFPEIYNRELGDFLDKAFSSH
jgi:pimeloyl-ACP methyl ester carboxylesterase